MLGWAALAMGLFYLAWRYNVLFVTDTQIDTRGLIYPRAMKQLFTGVYLAEICMIGLFGASVAPGPLVLMIIFLVFTVLFHISMNSALNPLMFNLPLNLLAEEEGPLLDTPVNSHATENGHGAPTNGNSPTTGPNYTEKIPSNGTNGAQSRASDPILGAKEALDAERHEPNYMTGKKPNFLTKFLKPWIYSDYRTLRAFLPRGVHFDPYAAEVERDAYCPPSVTSDVPLLWIPSDANGAGVSRQEVEHTSRAIPITDEGCELDEKGHLVWDQEGTRPPIWEEKIYY